MPLYEFYCGPCHTVFTFRAMRVDTAARPSCPVCGASLSREVSTFAHIMRGGQGEAPPPQGPDDTAARRMEEVMARMDDRIQALGDDDADPRLAVKAMREMAEAGGVQFDKDVREAMARIEAGEDPEKIDEQFSEVFDRENPFAPTPPSGTAPQARILRYLRPPRRDPAWHDL